MMDGFSLTLNNPLTEEQWDTLTDVDLENTDSITFYTKHGKEVRFVKEQRWIPVNEGLPSEPLDSLREMDDLPEYIVMIKDAEVPTVLQYAGSGEWYEDGSFFPVVAWRQLPEPYQGRDKAMNDNTCESCRWFDPDANSMWGFCEEKEAYTREDCSCAKYEQKSVNTVDKTKRP